MTFLLENITFLGSWCITGVAWLVAFDLLSRDDRGRPRLSLAAAGLAAGAAVWAQPSLASDWPAGSGFAPQLIVVSLAIAIVSTVCGLAVERKFADTRGLVSSAAILGLGIAMSHGALLVGLSGPHALDFEEVPIATATALTTPLALGAVLLRRRIAGPLAGC
jgi:NO-binding membrane sensor protein with MHYT domain